MTGNCHVRCGAGENSEITSKNYLSLLGITKEELPEFIITVLSEGKQVGIQNTRPIYEAVYKGETKIVAIDVGSNGFIVGANPASLK